MAESDSRRNSASALPQLPPFAVWSCCPNTCIELHYWWTRELHATPRGSFGLRRKGDVGSSGYVRGMLRPEFREERIENDGYFGLLEVRGALFFCIDDIYGCVTPLRHLSMVGLLVIAWLYGLLVAYYSGQQSIVATRILRLP